MSKLSARLAQPVDGSSSVFFRVAFGCCVSYWAWDYLVTGLVTRRYIEPKFHPTYYPFDFLSPLPGNGMYFLFLGVAVLGLMTAVGIFYRTSSFLMAGAFTYIFLLDRTNYQNHYYLISLIAWWLPWLPLHRMVSFDAWRSKVTYTETVPTWTLWILRFHIGLPYFMGGLAKLTPDWLLGFPMGEMMASKSSFPVLGGIAAWDSIGVVMAWSGLLFDTLIVFFLLKTQTRLPAFLLCVAFHLTNAVIFNIHIFPWFMIVATPIFFRPDWPRVMLQSGRRIESTTTAGDSYNEVPVKKSFTLALLVYCAFHLIWPLRHVAYEGETSWTERGHYFAWRMMLRGKKVVLGFAVKNKRTGAVTDMPISKYLSPEQHDKLGRDPEMILQFSHFLREQYTAETGDDAEVYSLALVSLNGRKPQLMIDPNIDLAKEPRGIYRRNWIVPLKEPLRWPPWNEPPQKWREFVELPKFEFLPPKS